MGSLLGTPQTSLAAGSATGTGTAIPVNNAVRSLVYIKWGANTTGGTVVIEGADVPGYTGTWVPFDTVNWTAAGKLNQVSLPPTGAVRARISSNITNDAGGTAATRGVEVTVDAHEY